jgi:erythronate-4-phosphate dehydrogenase
MKIVADSHIPFVQDYFGAYGELQLKAGRAIAREDVADADMLLVRSITAVEANLLAGSRVKFVGSVTAGADHLDTAWLDKMGIAWSVAEGFNALPVADYVISVIAALQRRHLLGMYRMKAAVVGVGKVGSLVAARLQLLGFTVLLCDPLRAEQEADFTSVPIETLKDLDLILLHVPLTQSGPYPTHHFIGKDFLQRQKPGCVLLNASRGAVIDSQALLAYGQHLRWCFDVWEHEPHINQKILAQAVIATPHIAGYSVQSKMRGIEMIYQRACQKKFIQSQPIKPLAMPRQELAFAGAKHHWQDIVLGVFNPLVMTTLMRTSSGFDELRHQFNYRHEFAFTSVKADLLGVDKEIIDGLM